MFDGKYQQLNKNGTFGWTRLTYVGEIKEKKQAGPSFGLMAPGYFWIDDVTLEPVGDDLPLTETPVLGPEEAPIEPPGNDRRQCRAVLRMRISEQSRRSNLLRLRHCAHGADVEIKGPAVKLLASFEDGNPLSGGSVVAMHASQGARHCDWIALSSASISHKTGVVTTSSRRIFTPPPRSRWIFMSRSATLPLAITGPGSITPRLCRPARARW